jgi:hypothetical protein
VQSGDADANGIAITALEANGGTIRDAALNDANLTLSGVGSTAGILIDTDAPAVTSVAVPANGTYVAGQNLDFTVSFSEAVTVGTAGGTPRLAVTLDSGSVFASYLSGSGSTALVFRYMVQIGDADANGIEITALEANGGTIRDGASNDANLALNGVPSTTGILIDTGPPVITSVSVPPDATYGGGDLLVFSVNFSEAVIVATAGGTPRLAIALDSGAVHAPYVSGSGTTALVFHYSVAPGDLDADGVVLTALEAGGATLRDASGHDASLVLHGVPSTAGVRIDAVRPRPLSLQLPAPGVYWAGQKLTFTLLMSEPVIVNLSGGTPSIDLVIGPKQAKAMYVSAASASRFALAVESTTNSLVFEYTIEVDDADGDGIEVLGLNLNGGSIADAAGNPIEMVQLSTEGEDEIIVVSPTAIPTANEWVLILLGLALAVAGYLRMRS